MNNEIYGMRPVNKTAGIVTGQSGCASDDTLTDEQKRENLVAIIKMMDGQLKSLKKGTKERKALSLEYRKICLAINELRPKKKTPGVENYVIDVLRDELSQFEFKRIFTLANKRMRLAADRTGDAS